MKVAMRNPLPQEEREQNKRQQQKRKRPPRFHRTSAPTPNSTHQIVTACETPDAPAPPPPQWSRQRGTSPPESAAPADSPTAAGSHASAALRHTPDRNPRCLAGPTPCR